MPGRDSPDRSWVRVLCSFSYFQKTFIVTTEPADESKPPKPAETSDPAGHDSGADPAAVTTPPADEGLPEWEPLTPELVEDEAIRGDFVIRWAVVGLALLFGFAPISETRTLIHIRTGEYLAGHGLLPPARDVFSSTASDRRWVNLAWLFDLTAAGIHAIAGGVGLSIVQGLIAALTIGLVVHTYRSGIRTWWGSICAALALLVCYPQFTVQPELITLVGMAGLLWITMRVEETRSTRLLGLAIPLIWLWSQLDPRAFLGPLLLLALAIGNSLSSGDAGASVRRAWWMTALGGLAVLVVHPFTWQSWLAPITLFGDYSALQQLYPRPGRVEMAFYPITLPVFWTSIRHQAIAALVLMVSTAVALFLNRERVSPGHWIAFLLFTLLGALATHELAVASLVYCVLCTVNAQQWYRSRFGQVYSTDWRELVFSRGGRAVTVLSLFTLSWVVISGRIEGPGGRQTGVGFSPALWTQMESYRDLAPRQRDDRPFHFAPRQGDLLIWAGQKSFVDMRGGLFAGTGDADLIRRHDQTRRALQLKRDSLPGSGEPDVWKETFAKYQITQTIPRLSAPNPDYTTFGDLLATPEWVLTDLVPSAAVFSLDGPDPELRSHAQQRRFDFVKQGFRTQALRETTRFPARRSTWSDRILSVRSPHVPADVQLATHLIQIASARGNISNAIRSACAVMAVRHATQGLRDDSNSVAGYQALAIAYQLLDQFETEAMAQAKRPWFSPVRYFQIVAALRQAALLEPDNWQVQTELLSLFERMQRGDLALEVLENLKRIRPVTAQSSEEERRDRDQLITLELSLSEMVAKVQEQADQQLEKGADRFQVAAAVYQVGAVRRAIQVLEDDPIYGQQNPLARSALGNWLIEAGRVEEGIEILEEIGAAQQVPNWRDALTTAAMISGDYNRAITTWKQQMDETRNNSVPTVLMTLPFVTLHPLWMGADNYPLAQLVAAGEAVGTLQSTSAMLNLQIGQARLELGDVDGARLAFGEILTTTPRTPLRPLAAFYVEQLTGAAAPASPSNETPLEDLGPLGEEPAEPAKERAVNSTSQERGR